MLGFFCISRVWMVKIF